MVKRMKNRSRHILASCGNAQLGHVNLNGNCTRSVALDGDRVGFVAVIDQLAPASLSLAEAPKVLKRLFGGGDGRVVHQVERHGIQRDFAVEVDCEPAVGLEVPGMVDADCKIVGVSAGVGGREWTIETHV